MPLPSQSARPQSRTTHMYRRRKPRRVLVAVTLMALLGLTAIIWAWGRSNAPQQSTAQAPESAPYEAGTEPNLLAGSEQTATRTEPMSSPSPATASGADQITMGQRIPIQTSGRRSSGTSGDASGSDADPPREVSTPQSASSSAAPERSRSEPDEPASRRSRESSSSGGSQANQRVADRVSRGVDLLATNRPIEARRVLTQALLTPGIDRATAREVRETLTEVNERLIFSRDIVEGDPFVFGYTIRPGDSLARIASRENTNVDWRFIQRINNIARPEAIQAGQKLKLVQGPFHAVVVKQEYRLDLFLGEGSDRVYVRSFPVGLGEQDSTPVGRFRVRPNSKLINPAWTNPRTGEHFTANDPENPIGNRWIGLEGITEAIQHLTGYGIHGTIEPESIGRQESMGCIRLRNEHVALLYEMLVERESTVEVVERR